MQYDKDMKTKPVTVTIPENVIHQIKKMADDQGRSFSNMVTVLLAEAAKK